MQILSLVRRFCCRHSQPANRLTAAATATLLFTLATPVLAQTISGTISGTVHDPSGAVIPNASITVTNAGQNSVVFSGKTNSAGQYTAPFLPVGSYSIAIEAPGFKHAEHVGINLSVNQN